MEKLIRLTPENGDFQQGFRGVKLQIRSQQDTVTAIAQLPPAKDIPVLYRRWQKQYQILLNSPILKVPRGFKKAQITNISLQDFESCRADLQRRLNEWLNAEEFLGVFQQICQQFELNSRDRVCCIIQTHRIRSTPVQALWQQLPWHWWEYWQQFDKVEFALSFREIALPTPLLPRGKRLRRTRILSILGNSQNINITFDRQAIENLRDRGASPVFLNQPQRSEFTQLWDEPWDILCFSGHSEMHDTGQGGWLGINNNERIEIDQLKKALRAACDRGLQIAIFNSCDGLGLARAIADLPLPVLIVWQSAVPDNLAQQFLLYFFQSFSNHNSLYSAIREAREKLELAWGDRDLCQLPLIIQNTDTLPLTWPQMRHSQAAIAPPPQISENRHILLDKVQSNWIKPLLYNSLQQRLRIELNLEEHLNAIDLPCKIAWETSQQQQRSLLPGTRAIDKFDELGLGRTLLLLGQPGSGKTTLLLEMAQELIADARQDGTLPIPVIFNLSTWGDRLSHKTLTAWLISELQQRYQVPKAQSKTWIEQQKLLLLLDGLDEVKAERRLACLNAINRFRQHHGRTEIIVCSRINDYNALPQKLQFQGAIYLKPLTTSQIEQYFQQNGESLAILKNTWELDATLQELAQTPLMLNIMTVAYQGLSVEQIPLINSLPERRQHLFDAYLKRMFARRNLSHLYPQDKALQWLVWLAQRLVSHSQTLFFIERMQPTWLSQGQQRQYYYLGVKLLFGLIAGFFAGFHFGSQTIEDEPWKLMAFAGVSAVAGAIAGGVSTRFPGFISGVLCGIIYVLIVTRIVFFFSLWNTEYIPKDFLWALLIDGIVIGLLLGFIRRSIGIVDTVRWSWSRAFRYLGIGTTFCVIYITLRIVLGNPYASYGSCEYWICIIQELSAFMIIFGLIGGLAKGKEIEKTSVPNQGIWRSLRNSLLFFAILTPIGVMLSFGRYTDNIYEIIGISSTVGILAALGGGQRSGIVLIQHFMLRLFLWFNRNTPWNYARFLDYASDRIILQKVGGGYIFVHRLLLEHLARSPLI